MMDQLISGLVHSFNYCLFKKCKAWIRCNSCQVTFGPRKGASVWRTHGQNMSYSWSSIHVHRDLCLDFHGMGWPCTIHHVLTPAILMFRLIHQGYRVLTHPCIWTFNMKTHGNASHFESKPKLTIEAKANRHVNYKDLTSRCHRNDGFGLV